MDDLAWLTARRDQLMIELRDIRRRIKAEAATHKRRAEAKPTRGINKARYAKAVELRAQGLTLKAAGVELGVSAGRVRQMVAKAQRLGLTSHP